MARKKVGIFTLAFGLIAIGLSLFLSNFVDLPIKSLYKYWPFLLISLGLEVSVYTLIYKKYDEKTAISIDGFVIAFIITVALMTSLYVGIKNSSIKSIGDIPFIKGLKFPHVL